LRVRQKIRAIRKFDNKKIREIETSENEIKKLMYQIISKVENKRYTIIVLISLIQ
jgi:hypothetical protein